MFNITALITTVCRKAHLCMYMGTNSDTLATFAL